MDCCVLHVASPVHYVFEHIPFYQQLLDLYYHTEAAHFIDVILCPLYDRLHVNVQIFWLCCYLFADFFAIPLLAISCCS